jgi:hypothetical protein
MDSELFGYLQALLYYFYYIFSLILPKFGRYWMYSRHLTFVKYVLGGKFIPHYPSKVVIDQYSSGLCISIYIYIFIEGVEV